MRYLSVCSGIEAATVAWHELGWKAAAFSEIEPFPSAVLNHHYTDVPNVGDMTKFKEWNLGAIDLLVGGTPCQSFSVAGLRKGLEDPRGNLALVYCGILDRFKPKWFVWENVPGVLSSNSGRDFGSFLGAVAELGYGFSWRVLDATHHELPITRKRVYVVGHLGTNWEAPAKVLLVPSERSYGEERGGSKTRPHSLTAQNAGSQNARGNLIQEHFGLRGMTPKETERALGFPDNYTNIPWRKSPESPDWPRYKALGNSMAVPVMKWIGQRIDMVNAIGGNK